MRNMGAILHNMKKNQLFRQDKGAALLIGMLTTFILFALGSSVGKVANNSARNLSRKRVYEQLFDIGTAGTNSYIRYIKQTDPANDYQDMSENDFPEAGWGYEVTVDDDRYPGGLYQDANGDWYTGDVTITSTATNTERDMQRQVGTTFVHIHPSAKYVAWAGNQGGGDFYIFADFLPGGSDEIEGAIYIGNGNVIGVGPVGSSGGVFLPPGSTVEATGSITNIASDYWENRDPIADFTDPLQLFRNGHATRNDFDVAKAFADLGITGGPLPEDPEDPTKDHPLRHLFVINPPDRVGLWNPDPTTPDDYFLEDPDNSLPTHELPLEDGKVYYVDGNLWIFNNNVTQFTLPVATSVRSTIAVSGKIHILDDIVRGDPGDALLLAAIGGPDSDIEVGHQDHAHQYASVEDNAGTFKIEALLYAQGDFNAENALSGPHPDYVDSGVANIPARIDIYGVIVAGGTIDFGWNEHPQTYERGRWGDPDGSDPRPPRNYKIKVEYDDALVSSARRPRLAPKGPGDRILTHMIGTRNWQEVRE